MTSLEKRLFNLFEPADVSKARLLVLKRVWCPRVGHVHATIDGDDGDAQEVRLELSARRKGGMSLESHSSSPLGRTGKPCALLAAVLLEVDRRGLFSNLHDHTPLTLDIVPAEDHEELAAEDDRSLEDDDADQDHGASRSPAVRNVSPPVTSAVTVGSRAGSTRLPAWAAELDERRRLVEPAVRDRMVTITDNRKSAGAVIFLLDLAASADARAAVLVPGRMQLDVAGNATGRPRPIVIGPGQVELDQLDAQERSILAQLVGALAVGELGGTEPLERRTIARVVVSSQSAATHLAMLCETGRLVLQPEPRRNPDLVVPLVWDGGRPWEFALVLEPDDVASTRAETVADMAAEGKPLPRPGRATLRGMLVRGSERKDLRTPRAILRSGLIVFDDRLARLAVTGTGGWMEQFERRGPIEFSGSQVDGLIDRLAMVADLPRLELPGWTGWQIESGAPRPKLVLDDSPTVSLDAEDEMVPPDEDGGGRAIRPARRRSTPRVQLAGRIWFDYAGIVIAADAPAGGATDPTRRILVRRDRAAERDAIAMLPRYGGMAPRIGDTDTADTGHHVEIARARLDASVSQLAAAGWTVEVSGRRYRPAGSVAWNVTSGIDWFELSAAIDFGGVTADLPALLEALAKGSRSVELSDGSMGILPESLAAQIEPMAVLAQKHDGRLRYGRIQMALLDALLAGQPQSQVDEAFERIRDELSRGERPEAEDEPEGFQGTLRHYQREGLGWLSFLERMGLGGCLADDMGLGKTIQVLAMFIRRQTMLTTGGIAHRPSLVIVPKSLVFNWIEEARKFAPSLRVLNYTGNTRVDEAGSLADHDIILTTYGTLRRDIINHREIEFDYVVLDEAQSIKNASSQAAKACRLLRARHRLALTGTPVENHIGELWSIFEFLNPGQLGSATRLKRFLAGGRTSSDVVARAVRPYLLRRTKKQVLSDLPEKTEQTLYCELGEEQRKVYDELREHYRLELSGRIGRMGIGRSRIAVLEALLRLRQTACHPGLVDPARLDEPAAKLDTLLEQLSEVIDEGHKVLVFSQFTSFLSIVRRHLDERGITYEYLDGKTTDRQARVQRFQEDADCRLFLVSLKAGGQGLNLTAADYIYILDPWWNPAVEAQAVDRAHRIGQTRRVFAYRLIARDTVEEKIVALQDRKRELAESIVRADESMVSSLTAEDVEMLLS
ncbi:MAG: DEAD/DEAH box helicase [Planctomycetia bacterium]|nr:DEAD/DEAH box helicase [Planctomycetia bacterium]